MRERLRTALAKNVTMPRWAIFLDFLYRCFLVAGACVVIVLWWQAATRDEEADRNARIQSCSSVYAATYSAWDAEAQERFGELITTAASQTGDQPVDPTVLSDYTTAVHNAAEMAKLRIGLGQYAAQSVAKGNDFACPALPSRLMVEAIPPR
jgi:hypothetical protein